MINTIYTSKRSRGRQAWYSKERERGMEDGPRRREKLDLRRKKERLIDEEREGMQRRREQVDLRGNFFLLLMGLGAV